MSIVLFASTRTRSPTGATLTPGAARGLLVGVVVASALASWFALDPGSAQAAQAQAGADLTRLLRFMAVIKSALAAGAVAAVVWRLGEPVSPGRFVVYALATAATAAGPGLIWRMSHVGLGALCLHGGLAATVLVLWRDPAIADALEAMLRRRRSRM